MRKTIFLTILIILNVSIHTQSQVDFSMEPIGYYKIKNEKNKIEIPFEIFKGDILVKPKINGIPTKMLVDNGTIWDQVYFFGSSILDALNLNYTGEIEVGGAGEGNQMINKTAENLIIEFENLIIYDQPAIISPPELGLQNHWKGVDGQISAQFFKHFITEIDYDNMIITLHEPGKFHPGSDYTAIFLTPVGNGSFYIPVEIKMQENTILKRKMILDLGGSCDFLYYFTSDDNINFIEQNKFKNLGRGAQGVINGYEYKVKEFSIGDYKIIEPNGEFVRKNDSNQHKNSFVGFNILSQFNSVYDYHKMILYIKPNKNFNKKKGAVQKVD